MGHRFGRYPEHGLAEADQQHRLPDEHWLPADRGDHGHPFKQIFNYIGGGATYICYVNGAAASYTTAIKYPVLAGGIAVRRETTGSVKAMMQLMPLKIDKVGAASVLSGNERYEMADNVQVYLWYKGQYYPTKLAQVDADGYQLTGWYDNFGCAAGKKVRVIIAVKND